MISLLLLLASAPLHHGWRCTTTTSTGTETKNIAVDYHRIGNSLVFHLVSEISLDFTYKIVHENDVGLVAVDIYSEGTPKSFYSQKNWINGDMIVINKKTGAYSKAYVGAPIQVSGSSVSSGYCIRF